MRFVWLMGADNLAQFHLWRDWQAIFRTVPVAVFGRPGAGIGARLSPAARRFRHARRPEGMSSGLACADPPAWAFVDMPLNPASSTAIRRSGAWNRG
jgi:nicotinate-nucleotide adenylyltransferase